MSSARRGATAANRRGDGPSYVHNDRDEDPGQRIYPRGVDVPIEGQGLRQRISYKCHVEEFALVTGFNAGNIAQGAGVYNVWLRASESQLAFPVPESHGPTWFLGGRSFRHIIPEEGQTGYTLIFDRPVGSEDTTGYECVEEKIPEDDGEPRGVRPLTQASSSN